MRILQIHLINFLALREPICVNGNAIYAKLSPDNSHTSGPCEHNANLHTYSSLYDHYQDFAFKYPLEKLTYERIHSQNITSTIRTPGIMGLSGKWPGKKLSFIVTFLMATAETPGLYSITLSTNRNGNLKSHPIQHNTSVRQRNKAQNWKRQSTKNLVYSR